LVAQPKNIKIKFRVKIISRIERWILEEEDALALKGIKEEKPPVPERPVKQEKPPVPVSRPNRRASLLIKQNSGLSISSTLSVIPLHNAMLASSENQAHSEECPICLDVLCESQVGILVDANFSRVCVHYLHQECALVLPNQECPLCRVAFSKIERLADVHTHRNVFFKQVDSGGNGRYVFTYYFYDPNNN
jgi:hypothetical protein